VEKFSLHLVYFKNKLPNRILLLNQVYVPTSHQDIVLIYCHYKVSVFYIVHYNLVKLTSSQTIQVVMICVLTEKVKNLPFDK